MWLKPWPLSSLCIYLFSMFSSMTSWIQIYRNTEKEINENSLLSCSLCHKILYLFCVLISYSQVIFEIIIKCKCSLFLCCWAVLFKIYQILFLVFLSRYFIVPNPTSKPSKACFYRNAATQLKFWMCHCF